MPLTNRALALASALAFASFPPVAEAFHSPPLLSTTTGTHATRRPTIGGLCRRAALGPLRSSKQSDVVIDVDAAASEGDERVDNETRSGEGVAAVVDVSPISAEALESFDAEDVLKKEEDATVTKNDSSSISSLLPANLPPYLPVLSLCFFIALLSALDRVAMSVAILPLSSELHLSETVKGQISSVFSVGYGLAILPCGLLVAAISPTAVMATGVALWSLATVGTPLAADLVRVTESTTAVAGAGVAATAFAASNVAPLLAARSVMGASESVVMPAIQRILINWVPPERRSRSIASVYAGFQMGTISAYFLSPTVIENFGWRGMFYVYGAAGALLVPIWLAVARDGPEAEVGNGAKMATAAATTTTTAGASTTTTANSVEGEEETVLVNTLRDDDLSLVPENFRASSGSGKGDEDILADCVEPELPSPTALDDALSVLKSAPWSQMVASKGVWAMTLAHAANNWGLYNNLSWTPTFYAQTYGLNVKESALLSILPSVAGAAGGLLAGTVADKVIQSLVGGGGGKGVDGKESDDTADEEEALRHTAQVRKAFQALALLGPSLCMFTLSRHIPDDPHVSQALLTASVGMQAFNAAGYGAATQEKAGERWAGLLYSVTSLPGVMMGSAGVYVTGRILDVCSGGPDGGWGEVFGLTSAVFAAGAAAFVLLYDARREFD